MKKLSILIPTYKRLGALKDCIAFINSNAKDGSFFELIFCADKDDDETIEFLKENNHIHVISKYQKYINLHHYYDECAYISTGEFLWIFNDDAKIREYHWDERIIPELQYNKINFFENNYWFPIYDRTIFEKLKRLSAYCYVDDWAIKLSQETNTMAILKSINIDHSNIGSWNLQDPVPAMRESPYAINQLHIDIVKLREYMEQLKGK